MHKMDEKKKHFELLELDDRFTRALYNVVSISINT